MLFGLDCLSKKVSDGHVNATSLRATIEEVYHTISSSSGSTLTDIEIDEEYEGAVYCTLRFTHGLVDGLDWAMTIRLTVMGATGLVDGATTRSHEAN